LSEVPGRGQAPPLLYTALPSRIVYSRGDPCGCRLRRLSALALLQRWPGEPQRRHIMPTTRDNGHGLHFLLMGALVGMLGGILMMLFVMLATATYLQMGFFTPLYAIAAPLTRPPACITSVLRRRFYLALGPA